MAAVRVHMPPAEGPAGIGPAAGGGGAVGGPAPPPVYMSAPEDATPKQGCIDACLGRSANPGVIKSPKKKKLKPGEEAQKRFYFRLDKIVCTFDTKLEEAFLELEVGGQFAQSAADAEQTVTATRKVKGPDGKETTEEFQKRVIIHRVEVLKPRAGTFYTRLKRNLKPKVEVAYHDHSFEGHWVGPYTHLARESLTIKLWHGGGWSGQNTLIGVGSERLSQVVASKIDREIRVLKYVPGGVSFRKETMARIRLKFELQEDYAYNIVFKNWELRRLHEPVYPAADDQGLFRRCLAACAPSGQRKLTFEVAQSRQGWGSFLAQVARTYLLPCASPGDNRCSLPVAKEGTSGRWEGVIRYPGTRAWLEDESVSIRLSKRLCGCVPVTLGHKAEELQGVLDYGHIDTTMEVSEDVNLFSACTDLFRPRAKQTFKVAGTVDSSSLTDGDSLPLFRQLGNADPSMDGLLSAEPGTFLVVKVVLAKGLSIPSRDEFKESLNPSVSVHWNGMQKSTRVARGSCDPFWDDEVHFKLPDRHTTRHKPPKKYEDFNAATRDSRVELMVWDNDGLAGRTALGKCHVDFFDIYFRRSYRKIISFASNGRHVERLVFQSGEMGLEAPFASDGAERKKAKGLGELESRKGGDEFNTRFVEFLVYFDRTDSNPVPLIHKKQKDRDALAKAEQNKKHIGEPLTAASIRSGRAFWDQALRDVMDHQKRFFPFYGVDELSGTLHFLPSFLKPMQPPAEIRNVGTLMFYIYAIEHSRKAQSGPPLGSGEEEEGAHARGDVWTWADPFFFLEKRKGDTKDHAIVLCNFLMGLGMDAYVCIGTARAARGAVARAPTPHFWVMTREESFEPVVPVGAAGAAAAPSSQAPGGPAAPPTKEYFIRFWETTNGRTYAVKGILTDPPANKRNKAFLEQPDVRPPPVDPEEFKRARQRQLEEERQKALGLNSGGGAGLASPSGAEGGDEGQNGQGGDDEDGALLALAAQAAADQAAAASSSGGSGGGGGNGHVAIVIDGAMRATMTQAEILQLELHNQSAALDLALSDPEENVSDLDLLSLTSAADAGAGRIGGLGGPGPKGPTDAAIKANKELLEEKSDMESVRSVFDEAKLARVQQARALRTHQKRLVSDLEDPLLRAQKKALGRQCPYASVDVVFNNKHLYANLGPSDPETVFFDFERHPGRWAEFHEAQYRQYLHIKHLKEFYPDRGLASVKAPQRDAEELEASLAALLRDTIATHRKYPSGAASAARPSMDTEFLRRFDFQMDESPESSAGNTAAAYIQKRLEHEHAVALQPRELLPLQRRLGHAVQLDYEYVDNDWRKKIVQELPTGYVYREECLFFKHSDSNRIATDTVRRCQSMIEMAEHRKPRFAVGCQLYRMAASVCPVRVFVCVIAKDE